MRDEMIAWRSYQNFWGHKVKGLDVALEPSWVSTHCHCWWFKSLLLLARTGQVPDILSVPEARMWKALNQPEWGPATVKWKSPCKEPEREREKGRESARDAAGVGYGWAESRVASRNECEKKAASHSIEVIVTSCQRSLTFWNRLRFDGHCLRFEVCNDLSEATTVEEAACKSRLNVASRKARFRTLEHMPNLCLKQPSKYFHKLQPRSQKAVKLTFSWALLRCASSWSQRL